MFRNLIQSLFLDFRLFWQLSKNTENVEIVLLSMLCGHLVPMYDSAIFLKI